MFSYRTVPSQSADLTSFHSTEHVRDVPQQANSPTNSSVKRCPRLPSLPLDWTPQPAARHPVDSPAFLRLLNT